MRCVVASPRSGRVVSLLSRVARGVCITGLVAGFSVAAALAQVPAVLDRGPPVRVVPYMMEPGAPAFGARPYTANPPATANGKGGRGSGSEIDSDGTGLSGASISGLDGGDIGDGTQFVALAYSQYVGQSVGSGGCVALVQVATSSVGLTSDWTRGARVEGDTSLAAGTIIATFDANGDDANDTDGGCRAAIYLGQTSRGIQALDQWAGSPAAYRTIRWSSVTGYAANTGSAFYVVAHAP